MSGRALPPVDHEASVTTRRFGLRKSRLYCRAACPQGDGGTRDYAAACPHLRSMPTAASAAAHDKPHEQPRKPRTSRDKALRPGRLCTSAVMAFSTWRVFVEAVDTLRSEPLRAAFGSSHKVLIMRLGTREAQNWAVQAPNASIVAWRSAHVRRWGRAAKDRL